MRPVVVVDLLAQRSGGAGRRGRARDGSPGLGTNGGQLVERDGADPVLDVERAPLALGVGHAVSLARERQRGLGPRLRAGLHRRAPELGGLAWRRLRDLVALVGEEEQVAADHDHDEARERERARSALLLADDLAAAALRPVRQRDVDLTCPMPSTASGGAALLEGDVVDRGGGWKASAWTKTPAAPTCTSVLHRGLIEREADLAVGAAPDEHALRLHEQLVDVPVGLSDLEAQDPHVVTSPLIS